MSNSDADNNVLTNFQPMLKRFMVWSVKLGEFLTGQEAHKFLFYKFVKSEPSGVCELESTDRHIICQSTNLFDKDGKEIFEGSIVDYDGDGELLGVVVSIDGQWQLKDKNGNLMFLKGAPHQKLVGHILSNPEL